MYCIYYQNPGGEEKLLFDPAYGLPLDDPVLTREAGSAGTLEFKTYKEHYAYGELNPVTTFFMVREGENEVFRGRYMGSEEDFYCTGNITCEGDLAFLYDSVLRPYEHKGGIREFMLMVLDNHNSQVEPRKQFRLGIITVTDSNDYINRSDSGYAKSLDVLRDKLVDTHGGYLRTRRDGNIYYLDYLEDYGGTNDQKIRFGENLLDLAKYIDATDIITALIPTGAVTDAGGQSRTLGIGSVNNGLDYVYDADAVTRFGWIWGTHNWKDVTTAKNLLAKAQEYIKKASTLPVTMQLNAIDLIHAGVDTESFRLGYWTEVIAEENGVHGTYLLVKMENHLANPEEDVIVLGGTLPSFTASNISSKKITDKQIQNVANNSSGIDLQAMTKEDLDSILV